jgi:hypothetical protein
MARLSLTPLTSLHVTRQQTLRHKLLKLQSNSIHCLSLIHASNLLHQLHLLKSRLKQVKVVVSQWQYTMV